MEPALSYLKKHAAGNPLIIDEPEKGLKYCVVLPAYLETRLEESLVSLFNADCPVHPVEILIVINWPENESPENVRLSHSIFKSAFEWAEKHSSKKKCFHVTEAGDIPRKKAGVGYARKTGMDEAIRRFLRAGTQDGIIISFDADSICDANYFTSIENHFELHPATDGCSVYFEHPLEGNEYSQDIYKAITQYELHMRCYLHSVRETGYPNAFYTVGSALAVRARSYCKQGGMNIRQAGEDFYFLQKFFDLGNFTDLTQTRVCPSPRPSLRVPFGTGKTIDQLIKSGQSLSSYNPAIFEILKDFFNHVPEFNNALTRSSLPDLSVLHPCLLEFLNDIGFLAEIAGIYENSGNMESFRKRFYRYFNMFRILKFVKHARNTFPDLPVVECARLILGKVNENRNQRETEKEYLIEFRRMDRI